MRWTKLSAAEKEAVAGFFRERFGIILEGLELFSDKSGRVFANSKQSASAVKELDPILAGMKIATLEAAIRPSTAALQLFGRQATKNVVEANQEQAKSFAAGGEFSASASEGYVIVSYNGNPLGSGFARNGVVKSLVPKDMRMELQSL